MNLEEEKGYGAESLLYNWHFVQLSTEMLTATTVLSLNVLFLRLTCLVGAYICC